MLNPSIKDIKDYNNAILAAKQMEEIEMTKQVTDDRIVFAAEYLNPELQKKEGQLPTNQINMFAVPSVDEIKEVFTFKLGKKSFIFGLLLAFLLGVAVGMGIMYVNQMQQELKLKDELIEKNTTIMNLKQEVAGRDEASELLAQSFSANIDEAKAQILGLKDDLNKKTAQLEMFMQRAELFDKYDYAIIHDGKRTDLTYDQIVFGENEMTKRGIDPQLLFSLVKFESKFDEDVKNRNSSATGYGQIISGTGKAIWEKLLDKDTAYNHKMALDGYNNLEMVAEYLEYKLKNNNYNVKQALVSYNGGELGERYYTAISRGMKRDIGYDLSTVQANLNKNK